MKAQAWVYVVVVVLSLGAGVAIAGTPDSVPPDPTLSSSATTEGGDGSVPVTTFTPGRVAVDPELGDQVRTTPSTIATSSTTATPTTTTLPPPARAEIGLAVVNGAEVGGSATRTANALAEVGYVDIDTFDGDVIVDVTVIYAVEGFQAAADRLAEELGLGPDLVFPLVTAPPIDGLGDRSVVLYLGRNIRSLSWFVN